MITGALADAPIIVDDPAPNVVARGFEANAVGLTVRFWFPSNMMSDDRALDAAIRSTYSALEAAGIELDVPDVKVIERRDDRPPDAGDDGGTSPA